MVKKYKVILTSRAQASLRRITEHLRQTASNDIAQKVRVGLLAAARSLKTLPNSHEALEQTGQSGTVYRRILKWEYKIIFTVREEKLEVVVFEIFHGARDTEKLKNILQ